MDLVVSTKLVMILPPDCLHAVIALLIGIFNIISSVFTSFIR